MVAEVEWAATGGSIDSKGMYLAGKDSGGFTAFAKADGGEAIAEVRIATKDDIPEIIETSGPHTIRWSGIVLSQKCMQFYTKVLSKYATSPDLKIEVSVTIEIPSELEETIRQHHEDCHHHGGRRGDVLWIVYAG